MKIEPTLRFSPPLLVPLLLVVLFSSCSSSPSESSVLWRSNAKLLQLMQQFPQFVGVLPEARLTRHQVPYCCCYFLLIFACDMTWSSPLWSLSPIDSLPCWSPSVSSLPPHRPSAPSLSESWLPFCHHLPVTHSHLLNKWTSPYFAATSHLG